jgi:cyclase
MAAAGTIEGLVPRMARNGERPRAQSIAPDPSSIPREHLMMRRLALQCVVASATLFGGSQSLRCQSLGAAPIVTRTQIAPGIFQFTTDDDGYVEQLNSVAIVTDRDVLVFDTNTRPSTARAILAEIRLITPKPVRFIANSHWHPDHWSGNQVYLDAFPDLEIIATEQTRTFMMNVSPGWAATMPRMLARVAKQVDDEVASGKTAEGVALSPARRSKDQADLLKVRDLVEEQRTAVRTFPSLTYTDRLYLHHGGRDFQFISVTGDAAGTTVLYLPKEKVLMTGDVVSYPLPYFTPPLSQHAKSIRELERLDTDVIIPGHGPAFRDKQYLTLEADLFEEIGRQVTAALRRGLFLVDDVVAAVDVDRFRARFTHGDARLNEDFPGFIKGMVRRAYLESRDSQESH